ncbi:MAG: DUF1810 domain-containing protein [Mycobacterium sp.]|nr:DUF1810 domain-containing protein [Mycobacterium sp.]
MTGFVFPQLSGLGSSTTAHRYAIGTLEKFYGGEPDQHTLDLLVMG